MPRDLFSFVALPEGGIVNAEAMHMQILNEGKTCRDLCSRVDRSLRLRSLQRAPGKKALHPLDSVEARIFSTVHCKKKLELLLSTSLEFKLLNYLDSQIEIH